MATLFLSGRSQLFRQTYEVKIAFNYISGLAPNAPVHFAGHDVGNVTDLRLLDEQAASSISDQVVGQAVAAPGAAAGATTEPLGRVVVTLRIDKGAVVKRDSQAYIDVLGFMGEKFIELTPGTAAAPPLGENDILRGSDPLAFYELVNMGTDVADTFKETTASVQKLIDDLHQTVGDNRPEIDGILANLNESSSNLKAMTEDIKWHPWKLLRKGKERSAEEIAREKQKRAKKG